MEVDWIRPAIAWVSEQALIQVERTLAVDHESRQMID